MTEIEQLLQQQLTSLQRQRSIEISEWQTQLDALLQQQQEQQREISSLEQQLSVLLQQHEQQQTLLNELLGLQKQQQEQQVILQRQHLQQQQSYADLNELCKHLRATVEQLFTDCERLSNNASAEAQQALQAIAQHRQQTDQAFSAVAGGLNTLQGSVNGLVERLPR